MRREHTGTTAQRLATGVPGFDEIMDGGLPRGGVTVVLGGGEIRGEGVVDGGCTFVFTSPPPGAA